MRRSKNLIALVAASLLLGIASAHAQLTEVFGITTKSWKYMIDNSDQYAAGFPNVDDSTWLEGLGLFGNDTGAAYPYPFVTTVPGSGGGVQTSYYRTHFNWVGSVSGVVLTMTNYIDDAIVIFLNGTEITRWNVVGTPLTHGTQAVGANPGGEPVRVVHQVSLDALTNAAANPLVAGDNVMAVAVHQAGTGSSDCVFGMSLYSSQTQPPCVPTVSPATTNAIACRNVTFTVTIPPNCGVPAPTIQWYRNVAGVDEPIAGATGTSMTVTNVQDGVDNGTYFVRLSNAAGSADSARSTLTVSPDTQGPQIVSFVGVATPNNEWLVTFDEPVVTLGGADDTFTYTIQTKEIPPTDPVTLSILSAVIEPNNPAQVRITTTESRVAGKSYTYKTGQDITDVCGGNVTPGTPGLSGDIYLDVVLYGATDPTVTWRYDDTGTDMGTTWKDSGFDDSSWKSGAGVFDGKDVPRTLVSGLSVGTQLQRRIPGTPFETVNVPTMYFRVHLDVPADALGVTVRTVADDGYVLYVNGVEVSRLRAPVATEGFATYAGGGTVGDGNYEGPVTIPLSALNLGGDNVFAALVKQNDATSSDITWGLEVSALVKGVEVDPPAILTQPTGVAVTEGHRFSLSVLASGTAPDYQWTQDGTDIPGANASTYTAIATSTSAGAYRVRVSNIGGTVTSDPANVTVRPVVVPYSHIWKYETNSQDGTLAGGTPWYSPAFNDSAWQSGPGPLGHETTAGTLARLPAPIATEIGAPSATFLTAYFRTTVTVPALTAGQTLVLTHLVDDGAVIYVDGNLVLQYNMNATPPILSTVVAPGTAPGDGDANLVSVPVSIPAGTHTIAVEIHQNVGTSSDTVWGGELRVISGAAPTLTITQPTPGNVTVSWAANPLYSLYQAVNVAGPFTAVPNDPQGTYNLAIPAADVARFFQIRFNGR